MKEYYISCTKMTVCVQTLNGVIIRAPAIVRKFKNQPLDNLVNWFNKIGRPVKIKELG